MARKTSVEKNPKIARLRQELIDADKNLESVNTALHILRVAQDNLNDDEEPKLDNFYKQSNEMENHAHAHRNWCDWFWF